MNRVSANICYVIIFTIALLAPSHCGVGRSAEPLIPDPKTLAPYGVKFLISSGDHCEKGGFCRASNFAQVCSDRNNVFGNAADFLLQR